MIPGSARLWARAAAALSILALVATGCRWWCRSAIRSSPLRARRYLTPDDSAESWLVFDDGRWIAQVASPLGFQVLDVRGDLVAGVWADSLGIEYVHVYRYGNDSTHLPDPCLRGRRAGC